MPYVGEELVSIRMESCSPAISQEKSEVLEVCSYRAFLQTALNDPVKGKAVEDAYLNEWLDVCQSLFRD